MFFRDAKRDEADGFHLLYAGISPEAVERRITALDDAITFTGTTTADQARSQFQDHDVVVATDDVDALGLLSWLRDNIDSQVPFVLVSQTDSDAVEALNRGADRFVEHEDGVKWLDTALLADLTTLVETYRTRERHRQRQQALDSVVQMVEGAYYRTDSDGVVTKVTPTVADILHCAKSETLLDDELAILDPDTTDRTILDVLDANDGSVDSYEMTLEATDGTRADIVTTARFVTENGEVVGAEGILRERSQYRDRQLTAQEERFRLEALFENMPEPIAYTEFEEEKPVVKDVNAAFEETFGISADDAEGTPLDDIVVPPEHREEAAAINERVENNEVFDVEVERLAADGMRTFRLRSVPLSTEEETPRGFAVYSDITQRKERQHELEQKNKQLEMAVKQRKAAETRYQSLFENNPVVIWEEDLSDVKAYVDSLAEDVDDLQSYLDDNPEDVAQLMSRVEIIDVNENAIEYYGAETKSELKENLGELMTTESIEVLKEFWPQMADGETEFRAETVSETLDGDRRHEIMDIYVPDAYADDYSRVYITGTDITERKERERQLEALNTRLQLALEGTNTGVWERTLETDELVWDDQTRQIFGYESGEFEGTYEQFAAKVHPDDINDVEAAHEESFEDGYYEAEYRICPDDETVRWVNGRAKVLYDEGEPTQLVGIVTDITQRKEREREIARKNKRLEEFASVVSHDLRNPLSVADGYLELVEDTGDMSHVEPARNALGRMETIIEDLLALARADKTVDDPDSVSVVQTAREAWEYTNSEGASLEVTVSDDLSIKADQSRLLQVFENLFRNAVDHNDSPVSVAVMELDTTSEDETDQTGIVVEDSGRGIPASDRSTVFNHGYTTDDEGTGFGLAIVQDIVAAHGWEIEITDGTRGGARFEITDIEVADG